MSANCEECVYYDYDEELAAYVCEADLDETKWSGFSWRHGTVLLPARRRLPHGRAGSGTTNHDKTAPWTDTMSKASVLIYTTALTGRRASPRIPPGTGQAPSSPGRLPAYIAVVPGLIDNAL